MRTRIRRMGNSQGVLIPRPLLAQAGLSGDVEMTLEDGAIVLRKPATSPREGWAQASRELAEAGDDALVWPEFPNDEDAELQW